MRAPLETAKLLIKMGTVKPNVTDFFSAFILSMTDQHSLTALYYNGHVRELAVPCNIKPVLSVGVGGTFSFVIKCFFSPINLINVTQ